jgi:hypothetical protein
MGYYIQGPARGKGEMLTSQHGAVAVPQPKSLAEVPEDKALICVIDNGPFEAAALIYSDRELQDFTRGDDWRPRQFFLMCKVKAHELCGYRSK